MTDWAALLPRAYGSGQAFGARRAPPPLDPEVAQALEALADRSISARALLQNPGIADVSEANAALVVGLCREEADKFPHGIPFYHMFYGDVWFAYEVFSAIATLAGVIERDETRLMMRLLPDAFGYNSEVRDVTRAMCRRQESQYVVQNDHCEQHRQTSISANTNLFSVGEAQPITFVDSMTRGISGASRTRGPQMALEALRRCGFCSEEECWRVVSQMWAAVGSDAPVLMQGFVHRDAADKMLYVSSAFGLYGRHGRLEEATPPRPTAFFDRMMAPGGTVDMYTQWRVFADPERAIRGAMRSSLHSHDGTAYHRVDRGPVMDRMAHILRTELPTPPDQRRLRMCIGRWATARAANPRARDVLLRHLTDARVPKRGREKTAADMIGMPFERRW